MNLVDFIVAVVLLTPLIYGALWFHYSRRMTNKVADQIVRDLHDKSQTESRK